MGGSQAITKDRNPGIPGSDRIVLSVLHLSIWLSLVLIAVTPNHTSAGSSDSTVGDLWDMPHSLESICGGQRTLLFLCNPGISTCREGAVHFDSQARAIRAEGIQPACLFIGPPRDVRSAVLTLDLIIPVYVDPDGRVCEDLVGQKVLPAMVLLDGSGNVIRSVQGGGESLDNNLKIIIGERRERPAWRFLFALLPLVVIATVLLVLN